MKPLVLDGIIYDKKYVDDLKWHLRAVSDCLLDQNHFYFAYALLQIHAILTYYSQLVEDD